MKKHIALAILCAGLASPTFASAQTPPSPPAAVPAAPSPAPKKGQDFQARKNEIVLHINTKIAQLQQRMACVQAAADRDGLKACMPPKGRSLRKISLLPRTVAEHNRHAVMFTTHVAYHFLVERIDFIDAEIISFKTKNFTLIRRRRNISRDHAFITIF